MFINIIIYIWVLNMHVCIQYFYHAVILIPGSPVLGSYLWFSRILKKPTMWVVPSAYHRLLGSWAWSGKEKKAFAYFPWPNNSPEKIFLRHQPQYKGSFLFSASCVFPFPMPCAYSFFSFNCICCPWEFSPSLPSCLRHRSRETALYDISYKPIY